MGTGAEILVTTCPFCVLNLEAGAKKIGSDIRVLDISELLMEVTDPEAKVPAAVPEKTKAATSA